MTSKNQQKKYTNVRHVGTFLIYEEMDISSIFEYDRSGNSSISQRFIDYRFPKLKEEVYDRLLNGVVLSLRQCFVALVECRIKLSHISQVSLHKGLASGGIEVSADTLDNAYSYRKEQVNLDLSIDPNFIAIGSNITNSSVLMLVDQFRKSLEQLRRQRTIRKSVQGKEMKSWIKSQFYHDISMVRALISTHPRVHDPALKFSMLMLEFANREPLLFQFLTGGNYPGEAGYSLEYFYESFHKNIDRHKKLCALPDQQI